MVLKGTAGFVFKVEAIPMGIYLSILDFAGVKRAL